MIWKFKENFNDGDVKNKYIAQFKEKSFFIKILFLKLDISVKNSLFLL